MTIKNISTQAELRELAAELGMRPDWHEPDERGVTAQYGIGHRFNNAGFHGEARFLELCHQGTMTAARAATEMSIVILHDGEPVAEVSLATLFAFACGTYDGE